MNVTMNLLANLLEAIIYAIPDNESFSPSKLLSDEKKDAYRKLDDFRRVLRPSKIAPIPPHGSAERYFVHYHGPKIPAGQWHWEGPFTIAEAKKEFERKRLWYPTCFIYARTAGGQIFKLP